MKKIFSPKKLAALLIPLALCSMLTTYGENLESEAVEIIAIEIPGLHQKDGNGEYDKILKSIPGLNYKIKVVPPKRAFYLFEKGSNCALSPANTNPEFYNWKPDIKQTIPMGEAKIFIFSPDGKAAVNHLIDLKGKLIGIRHGMPYGSTFEKMKFNTESVHRIEQNIKKLDLGNIDYMVAYTPDAYDAFKSINKTPYPHNKSNPIAVHFDRLVYKGVANDFIRTFNEGVKKYNASQK